MQELRLGIDVASVEQRFRTISGQLEALWTAVRAAGEVPVVVVMEPTRNAWVPLAAWLRARGATVRMVPPQRRYDLRDLEGRPISEDEGRALCTPLTPNTGTGRRSKESQGATSTGPSTNQARPSRKSA